MPGARPSTESASSQPLPPPRPDSAPSTGAGSTAPRRPQRPPAAGAPARPTTPPRPAAAPTTSRDARHSGTPDGQRRPYGADATNSPENRQSSAGQGGPAPSRAHGSGPTAGQGPARGATTDTSTARLRAEHPRFSDFRRTAGQNSGTAAAPPPPVASSRFPDAPPPARDAARRTDDQAADSAPASGGRPPRPTGSAPGDTAPRPAGRPPAAPPRTGAPAPGSAVPPTTLRRPLPEEAAPEGTPRPRPLTPDRPGGWQPPTGPSRRSAEAIDAALGESPGRPFVSFAQPDTAPWTQTEPRGVRRKPRASGARAAAVAACVVLGVGLIGGAAAGSWLTGDPGTDGARDTFAVAGELWHGVPVDELFPPTVQGEGAGPGGTDRAWTRIAVAPDSGCADAFDPLLRKALSPVGCLRLLRATYTDATRSNVTTVGLMFTKADATTMTSLKARFEQDGLDRRTDLMPRPYAAKDTVAAGFGDDQRASWTISVLTEVPVVVYAVSGFADGRSVTEPQPAEDAMESGATTAPAQSGLGHEAKGLADRIERGLRRTAASATEKPS